MERKFCIVGLLTSKHGLGGEKAETAAAISNAAPAKAISRELAGRESKSTGRSVTYLCESDITHLRRGGMRHSVVWGAGLVGTRGFDTLALETKDLASGRTNRQFF